MNVPYIPYRKYEYYKIIKEHQRYKGVRYFRFRFGDQHVLQVCRATGEIKKGKSNTFGIYLIDNMTFISNYLSMGYAIPCRKKEFDKQFDFVVKVFKNEPRKIKSNKNRNRK